MAVAATVGTRPGTEMDRMTWGQVEIADRGSNFVPFVTFHLRANQGKWKEPRQAIAYQGPGRVFDLPDELKRLASLQGRNWPPPRNALLFARADGEVPKLHGTFHDLLVDLDLLTHRKSGKDRCRYSIRHYYGTEAAVRGVDTTVLARQMGTSPAMLHRYYNHSDAKRHAATLSGERHAIDAATERARAINPDDLDPWDARLGDDGDIPAIERT